MMIDVAVHVTRTCERVVAEKRDVTQKRRKRLWLCAFLCSKLKQCTTPSLRSPVPLPVLSLSHSPRSSPIAARIAAAPANKREDRKKSPHSSNCLLAERNLCAREMVSHCANNVDLLARHFRLFFFRFALQ